MILLSPDPRGFFGEASERSWEIWSRVYGDYSALLYRGCLIYSNGGDGVVRLLNPQSHPIVMTKQRLCWDFFFLFFRSFQIPSPMPEEGKEYWSRRRDALYRYRDRPVSSIYRNTVSSYVY